MGVVRRRSGVLAAIQAGGGWTRGFKDAEVKARGRRGQINYRKCLWTKKKRKKERKKEWRSSQSERRYEYVRIPGRRKRNVAVHLFPSLVSLPLHLARSGGENKPGRENQGVRGSYFCCTQPRNQRWKRRESWLLLGHFVTANLVPLTTTTTATTTTLH